MSVKNKILIDTYPQYVESQSSPEDERYVFAYTITITNVGIIPARLLSRYWLIIDSNGKAQEVTGKGVVGEQPYLKPGETFQYSSGTMIETDVGIMEGNYLMISDEGDNFKAEIPQFTLSIPRVLH